MIIPWSWPASGPWSRTPPISPWRARRARAETAPDVAVIDISLPEMSGLELARSLAAAGSSPRLLVLTVHEYGAYVQPLLQAGVRGHLLKRSAAEELVQATRTVAGGGFYLDP